MKIVTVIFICLASYKDVFSHDLFSTGDCLEAHNKLRLLHSDTNDVSYSKELEKTAQEFADKLEERDITIDVRPTRVLPKRRKRHVDDVDPNVHLESWSGDIFFPSRPNSQRVVNIGENIHKFCCHSYPHCPKQFFHNLQFPPSASNVVKDWYNEEIDHYDFENGVKKTSYSQIIHFTNIVWRNTTKIGCAQSRRSADNCVYTIVLYEGEGSIGNAENFKKNVGSLKSEAESSGSNILVIFLAIFFVVLLVAAIILCYCCRDNLQEKYLGVKIKVDTMKAEQELETDSTNFWWLRICKRRKFQRRRTTVSRPKHVSLKERPTIEIIPNSAPQRTGPPPPRVRGQSNASMASRYHGISKKPENVFVSDNRGYEAQKPLSKRPLASAPVGKKPVFVRTPSLSGKAPPPPVPVVKPPSNPLIPPRPSAHRVSSNPTPPARPLLARATSSNEEKQPISQTPPVSKLPGSSLNKPPAMPLKPPFPGRPSPKPLARPFSVPTNQSPKPGMVPRKHTAPIEGSNMNPVNRDKPPLLPPIKPKNLTSDDNTDDLSNRTVSEMRKLLENN